jgi:hypothetical protein
LVITHQPDRPLINCSVVAVIPKEKGWKGYSAYVELEIHMRGKDVVLSHPFCDAGMARDRHASFPSTGRVSLSAKENQLYCTAG